MLFLSFCIVGCAVQKQTRPATPFAAVVGPVILAHRGGSLEAPENTRESIAHGIAVGADWQELDVTLSKDGEVVVIHDDTLERTTNGTGKVADLTLAELMKLSAGNPRPADSTATRLKELGVELPAFGERFKDARIPTLDEVLKLPDARLMVELKESPEPEQLVRKTLALVRDSGIEGRIGIACFDARALQLVHDLEPALPLIGLVEDEAGFEKMLELPLAVLAVSTELASLAMEKAPPGIAVWVWTVYSAAQAQEIAALGVHGIITDAPSVVLKALRPDDSAK